MSKTVTETIGISRRSLLSLVMGSLGLFCYGRPARSYPISGTQFEDLLIGAFWHDKTPAMPVGIAYLKAVPTESSRNILLQKLLDDGQLASQINRLGAAEIRAILSEKIRRDFYAGNTLEIDGWVLSRTELRLCALAVII